MYIFSFIKSLLTPRKILVNLFFLANLVVIFFIFGYMNLFKFSGSDAFLCNGLIGLGINGVILLLTLSPFGEAIMRLRVGAKKIERNLDSEFIYDIFDEVYARTLQNNPRLSKKIKLYLLNDESVNAFALGHRTIILTTGMLELSEDKIKAAIAHEFGHLVHGDSNINLGIYVSNWILFVVAIVYTIVVALLSLIIGIFSSNLAEIFNNILNFLIFLVYGLWIKIGMLLVNLSSRKDEFAADAYAVDLNYGKELYDLLYTIDPSRTKMSFTSLLNSTHPNTVDRLDKIRKRKESVKN